jgi:hypothetical protein
MFHRVSIRRRHRLPGADNKEWCEGIERFFNFHATCMTQPVGHLLAIHLKSFQRIFTELTSMMIATRLTSAHALPHDVTPKAEFPA